jgi:type IV/VI secretion system ImpK/VasF family protein
MQPPIAEAVLAIFNCGLTLRDRLEAGESLQWDLERATLKQLLSVFLTRADDTSEFGNELVFSEHGSAEERSRLSQATIRFALTCWLDEWFTRYSTQAPRWRERTLETELFGSTEGGTKFWDEARYAETRGDLIALEAMHLCVMLGFRGAWRDKPAQVETWAARIRLKLQQAAPTWTMPACLEPPRYEAAQEEDASYRRMLFSMLLMFSLLLPLALVFLWRL